MEIWKFEVPMRGPLMMPRGSRPLYAREQRDSAYVWAMVDPKADLVPRALVAFVTGAELPDNLGNPLGVCMLPNGIVLHVFDQGEG